ncbi:UNVERIFIED_CONTAM: FtsK/SpoIIIE domain-containing protein [Microbacterium sp. SLM126]
MHLSPAPAFSALVNPVDDAAEPLSLPAAWSPPARPPFPVVAAIVPVVGAVGLWFVTGSILSLWLAALGPLIAVATMADAARSARRDRKRHLATAVRSRAEISRAVDARHASERGRLWARHPDVAGFVAREDDVWRLSPERADALVAGEGEIASALRLAGGEGDPDAVALRVRAGRLTGGPVVVPAGQGVVVVGAPVLAAAVQRALVLQLCLALPPGELAVVGGLDASQRWADRLPHRRAPGGRRVAMVAPGEAVPPDADIAIARRLPGEPLPPRCATVLTIGSPGVARLERAGEAAEVKVEAIARDQAAALAETLAHRAERTLGIAGRDAGPIQLGPLIDPGTARAGALTAVIGLDGTVPAAIDLVADGPHAIVAGVTGSGKSELLITWILSLCRTHSTREVSFLLADFKGGTAFDALAGVPHVTGVITDLEGTGARRAIESLRAEVRRREAAIAGAGARDILDPRVELPRLVVVVDEFAALLADHPELHAVFTDVAARGRALGIHLILGTQRSAGVIRESLLANCPLRISLRVSDAADSRTVLGTDDAAHLPGGPDGRGHAFVRGSGDARPRRVRVALSAPADVAAASAPHDGPDPRRPWLPELPRRLALDDPRLRADDPAQLVLALADEPGLQRQSVATIEVSDRGLLVLGGPGAGASNVLRLLAAQATGGVVRVPGDPEGVWDAVAALAAEPPRPGTVVCIDDLDAVTARLPPDHAQVVVERIEDLLRGTGPGGFLVVASARRLTGPVARVADLFPRRLLLAFPTRVEHIAAGGEADRFRAGTPAGRGMLGGVEVQVALAPAVPDEARSDPGEWRPTAPLTGFVSRRSPSARAALAEWQARGIRISDLDAYVADPSITAHGPVVLSGEPDDWQRHWRLLSDVRGDHELVVDASCAAELRLLTGARGLPPYCEPGRGRAWLVVGGAEPVRIVLSSSQVRPIRSSGLLDRPGGTP